MVGGCALDTSLPQSRMVSKDGSGRQLLSSCQGKAREGSSGAHVRRGVRTDQGRVGVWEGAVSLVGPAVVRMRGILAGEQARQLILTHSRGCQSLAGAEGSTKPGKAPIPLFNGGCSFFIFPFLGTISTAVLRPGWKMNLQL